MNGDIVEGLLNNIHTQKIFFFFEWIYSKVYFIAISKHHSFKRKNSEGGTVKHGTEPKKNVHISSNDHAFFLDFSSLAGELIWTFVF